MLINHANLGLIFTGWKATFKRGWDLAAPMWNRVAMELPSTTEKEEYDWLGMAPGMREWVDERFINSLGTHGFQITNKDWEQTIGVERNKILDDTYGVYTPVTQRMGQSAALHLDELVFGLLNNGSDADALCYDGEPFFSTSHPNDETGTQSNLNTGSGPAWYLADLESMLMPLIVQMRQRPVFVSKTSLTDDEVFLRKRFLMGVDARYNVGYGMWQSIFRCEDALDATNFEATWEAMTQLTAPNGKPMAVMPTALIVPTSLYHDARRLVAAALTGGGDTNIHQNVVSIIVSKHLDNT